MRATHAFMKRRKRAADYNAPYGSRASTYKCNVSGIQNSNVQANNHKKVINKENV